MRIFLDDNHSRCSNNKNVCKPQGGIDASERGQIAFHKGWMAHDVFEAKRAYLTRYEIDVSAPFDGSYALKSIEHLEDWNPRIREKLLQSISATKA
ncbi:hypothetical protein FVF58_39990 [Paraburkholderia panacisoli]|jgi:hypothetical protein|uniref:Uncharacterized protein n=1 Tax=Paraburkholderia panacisoli TaxID=2603818 RepID=A0A5B0GFP9_9BURK|nr:hypothetical protein [Paraburkholderia panacisoli]KAA1000930.1 hypothetical protein FVF58_39990 [Paraburkholderia panacisoli]